MRTGLIRPNLSMADTKITALTNYTTPATTDVLPIVDVTNTTTKKITLANIAANLGAAIVSTINKLTITTPATGSTLTIADGKTLTANSTLTLAGTDSKTLTVNKNLTLDGADGKTLTLTTGLTVNTNDGTLAFGAASKTLTVNKILTLDGTDSTTMTFPSTSATLGGLAIAQTWTAQNKFNNLVDVTNAITASSNAATVPVTYRLNTVTNDSAGNMTITMTTTSAVDGQMTIVRIYDFSAVAKTITWTNTEDSTVVAPTTSNGSTTLPLTVGFMYNSATSHWRCIAKA